MKKIALMLILALSFSCKNDKTASEQDKNAVSEIVEPPKPKKFIVELEMKYAKSESIRLFANGVFINNSRTMNISLTEKIDKSEDFNNVILDFPENIKPDYEVGLALGSDTENTIEIARIKISYGDIEFVVSPNELKNYFYFSKYVDYNEETGILITNKIDGKLNPTMYLNGNIVDQIGV